MGGGLIAVEEKETHAVICLDRPEKKNAMNRAARRELLAALAALQRCRAIVLTGTGDSFCSGVDLKEIQADAEAGTPPEPASDWIEVNLAIRRHPAVAEVAVFGVPDERLGEKVAALVQLRDSPDPKADLTAIESLCRAELARYKVPDEWGTVGQFPLNAMGKIIRTSLVALLKG